MGLLRRFSWLTLAVLGCGAPPPPDLHAAFRAIQVHEATIANHAGDRERVCDAAEGVCAIATEVEDEDALARCEVARRRCASESR